MSDHEPVSLLAEAVSGRGGEIAFASFYTAKEARPQRPGAGVGETVVSDEAKSEGSVRLR